MKSLYSTCTVLVLGACSVGIAESNNSVMSAQPYIGLQERVHRNELKELLDVDPVRTEWCAAFVNSVLEIDSIPNLNDQDKYPPLMARSFLYWGESVEPELIQRGDLVVFPRGNSGWKGHVGFFVEERNGQWVILGGNQNNEVRYDLYSPRRALGIRRYPTQEVAGSLPKWMMDKY